MYLSINIFCFFILYIEIKYMYINSVVTRNNSCQIIRSYLYRLGTIVKSRSRRRAVSRWSDVDINETCNDNHLCRVHRFSGNTNMFHNEGQWKRGLFHDDVNTSEHAMRSSWSTWPGSTIKHSTRPWSWGKEAN